MSTTNNGKTGRALVLSPMLPPSSEEDRGGMHRRVGLWLRALAQVSDRIDIVHIVPPALMARGDDAAALDRDQSEFWGIPLHVHLTPRHTRRETLWNHYVSGMVSVSEQPAFRGYGGHALIADISRHLGADPDLVLVDRLEAMIPVLHRSCRPRRLMLDLNDVEHKLRWGTAGLSAGQVAGLLQLPALLAAEYRGVRLSTVTTVCSEIDRAHLARLGFGPSVTVLPNAVALPQDPPGLGSAPAILFLGACTYGPNHDAAERLARRIWPAIRVAVPQARLILAGQGTDRLPSRSDGIEGVEYRGFVAGLPELYAETRLVCCPLLQRSGTRLKLVEAAAYARPMVSTRIGAEGLDFTDGTDILIRETDRRIAEACVALLHDDAACPRLGRAARVTMAARYDTAIVERRAVTLMTQPAPR